MVVAINFRITTAWHMHFATGYGTNFFYTVAGPDQPPAGYLTAFGSTSTIFAPIDSIGAPTQIAYSVICGETQRISKLRTYFVLTMYQSPGGNMTLETRVRTSNTSVVDFEDTRLVTYVTTDTGNDGYPEYFAATESGESSSTDSFICQAGTLMILETRITCYDCGPYGSYIEFFAFMTASLEITQFQQIPFSSGQPVALTLVAAGLTQSGFVSGFGQSSRALTDVTQLDDITLTGFSWICPRNGTFGELAVTGQVGFTQSFTSTLSITFQFFLASGYLPFAGTSVTASVTQALSAATAFKFQTDNANSTFDCNVGDRVVLQTQVQCPTCGTAVNVSIAWGANAQFF
jgi:hypothetical protein